MARSNWIDIKVADVFHVQLGKMLSPKAKTGEYAKPYIGNSHVQWGRFVLSDLPTMDFPTNEHERFRLRAGDLLMCEGGEVGRCAIWKAELGECFYQKALHRLRPRDERAYVPFIAHWFEHNFRHLDTFKHEHGKTTIAHLPKERLEKLSVTLPPLPEQKKIAAVLSSVDAAIEKTEAVIAQLQVVKKAMMEQLLTKGLPGRHTRFKQTELGEIPEEWEVVSLGSAGEWLSGGTPSKNDPHLWSGQIPWVSPKDMKIPRIGNAEDHVHPDAIGNGTRLVPPDTLLMVVRGMILAHTFPVCLTTAPVTFNQDIKALRPSDDFEPEFLLFWLQHAQAKVLEITEVANHGTKRIPTEQLHSTLMPCPPRTTQKAIVSALKAIDLTTESSRSEKQRLIAVKSSLSSSLLSGELRVPTESVPCPV
jgi:type I restriction enzyme S subunit